MPLRFGTIGLIHDLEFTTEMLYTISRPPSDTTWPMFVSLLRPWYDQADIFYMWSNPPHRLEHFLTKTKFEKSLVILGIKDLLDGWQEYNWWNQTQQPIPKLLGQIAREQRDKNFIIFTSLEHLEKEIVEPNVWIVPWGGDIINQKQSYLELEPVVDKNFDSSQHFICLNRQSRDHRIVTVSYLIGRDLARHGYISYLWNQLGHYHNQPADILDRICWEFDEPRHTEAKHALIQGYPHLSAISQDAADDYEIYLKHQGLQNDNASNFDKDLRPKYQNSFVEIVSESSFCAPSFNITEKTANAFWAYNFPIFLGGAGLVQHLRDTGLDLFDDIIDHSYDQIPNPFDRIFVAIDQNQRLLSDGDWAKQKWLQCRTRFDSNLDQIKKIYQWYDDRTVNKFHEVIQNISKI